MARRCVFVLIHWLLYTHVTTALAGTLPQQARICEYLFTQYRNSPVASSTTPQAVDTIAPSASDKRLPTIAAPTQDNTQQYRDMAKSKQTQRAWGYSAILPGWGQVYNKQYWKVPAIYVGFVGLGWGAIYYHREYVTFKQRLIQKKGGNSAKNYVDECRQGRDLCVMLAALWYVINIFDAYVAASLKTFTLSDDISMKIQPSVLPTTRKEPNVGLTLTLSLGA